MAVKRYAAPEGFKRALEERLRTASGGGARMERRRQLLIFDRFLARVVEVFGDAATLKGGLVLELRLARARTTRDIDLRVMGTSHDTLARLQQAGRRDLGDFLQFDVVVDADHPVIDGVRYEGERFRVVCRLAGRPYGAPFGVDVAFGDPMLGDPDVVVADDVLAFAGVAPPTLRLYPVVTHVAEKLHAYTLPRDRPNSRVKDLPDIALLSTLDVDAADLRAALAQTFAFRQKQPLPTYLPPPPPAWATPYATMARENSLAWATLDEVFDAARSFLDPVLTGVVTQGAWRAGWR